MPLDVAGLPGCESCHEWALGAKVWAMIHSLLGVQETADQPIV